MRNKELLETRTTTRELPCDVSATLAQLRLQRPEWTYIGTVENHAMFRLEIVRADRG